jgi:hypothetical protein
VARKAASGGSAAKETKMTSSTTFDWFKRLLVLGSIVACATASAAGASGVRSSAAPDVFERYAAAHQYGSASAPDVLERYVATHPYGVGTLAVGTDRIVDDSFRDPTPIVSPVGDRIVDDSFRDAPTVVASAPSGNGLDWADFGIGAGAMLGLTLLVAGLALGGVALRHRGGRLETS